MIYKMRLHNDPFLAIKSNEKCIEMRLNDEKRKNIKKGDKIEFTNTINNSVFYVEVVEVYKYPSFEELYKNHNKIDLGNKENETAAPEDMLLYYSKEDIKKYGVLAISIKPDDYENEKVRRINNTIDIVNNVLGTDIEKINNK